MEEHRPTTDDLAQARSSEDQREEVEQPAEGRTEHDAEARDSRAQVGVEEGDTDDEGRAALFGEDDIARFRGQWEGVQAGFVDEPRRSVEQADSLVAELMQQLASSFSEERSRLESQWDSGDDVSTEDLRVALTRYRLFFQRLLAA